MLLSLSNFEEVGVPLIDISSLKNILAKTKKSKKKKRKSANKRESSREEIFKQIIAEMRLENDSDEDSEESDETDNQVIVLSAPVKKEFESKDVSIKIASKKVQDSHYQVDVSKDKVVKNGKDLIMISAYLKEGYLGKYLMKRNYYYLTKNESSANETFSEIVSKVKRIKKSYHEGGIEIKGVTSSVYKVFEGIISDVKFNEEDELGTNVRRNYFKDSL